MTTTDSPSLDATLLQKVRHQPTGKITARCPACAETGGDRTGNHLVIFPDGRFACAAHPGDADHRRRVHRLAGHPTTTSDRREWDRQAAREQQNRQQRMAHLTDRARSQRGDLISRHAWHPADVWEDSPQRIDGALTATCPRHFLASLFDEDALLWTGEVHHSGTAHRTHWRTCQEWESDATALPGPMTTPAIWRPGTVSRTASQVLAAPYTVLDFDGFDGIKPTTPDEMESHFHASLALIRWLRERLRWKLAAILHTGGKSLHAWFHSPSLEILETLRQAAHPLGIDAGLIGRPEHPCRLPGQIHPATGGISQVLWLR